MISSLPLFGTSLSSNNVETTTFMRNRQHQNSSSSFHHQTSPSASVRDAWLNERRQNKYLAEKKQKEDERFAVLTGTFFKNRQQKRLSLVSSLKSKSMTNFLQKSGVKKTEEEKRASRNRKRLIKAIEEGRDLNLDDDEAEDLHNNNDFDDDEEDEDDECDGNVRKKNYNNKKKNESKNDEEEDASNPFLISAAKDRKRRLLLDEDDDDYQEEEPDFYKYLPQAQHRFLAKIHDEDEYEKQHPKTARERQEELDRDYSYLLRSAEQEKLVQTILEQDHGEDNSLHSKRRRRNSPSQNQTQRESDVARDLLMVNSSHNKTNSCNNINIVSNSPRRNHHHHSSSSTIEFTSPLSEIVLQKKRDLLFHSRRRGDRNNNNNTNNHHESHHHHHHLHQQIQNSISNAEQEEEEAEKRLQQDAKNLESRLSHRFHSLAAANVRSTSWADVLTLDNNNVINFDTEGASLFASSDEWKEQQQTDLKKKKKHENTKRVTILNSRNNGDDQEQRHLGDGSTNNNNNDDDDDETTIQATELLKRHQQEQQQQQQQSQNEEDKKSDLDDVENSASHLRQVARRHHVEQQLGVKRKIAELISNCHEKLGRLETSDSRTEKEQKDALEEKGGGDNNQEGYWTKKQSEFQVRKNNLSELKKKSRELFCTKIK